MSNPSEPSDQSKPVVKDKNPHNYRKVGYSMIVISVSLVLIGLLVWAIGDNWHFSTDIMANQEIDAMTPKHGFNLVYYDTAQPVGAKLKLLDSASTIDDALQKQSQYSIKYVNDKAMVIIFNETLAANQKLVKDTIDTIDQIQTAKAQAIKIQQDKAAQSSAPVTNTTNTMPSHTQNITSTKILANSTISSMVNNTKLVQPTSNDTEKISINSNLTVKMNVNSTNTDNATNPDVAPSSTNSTSGHSKSASVSETVGITEK